MGGIPAGDLDREIQILRADYTTNDLNEQVPTWRSHGAPVRAKAGFKAASEKLVNDEVAAVRIRRFLIRCDEQRADMLERGTLDRIEFPVGSGTHFDILEVNEWGRQIGIEIFATARADEGTA